PIVVLRPMGAICRAARRGLSDRFGGHAMTAIDPYLLVRAVALYLVFASTTALWMWRRPGRRLVAGVLLASLWNLPIVLALNLLAVHLRWWRFDAHGGLFLGMPVELYLAWAWLWGAIPALAFPAAPLLVVMAFALAVDVALMPAAAPVIQLGPSWWLGEAIGVAAGVLPGQLLARWTLRDDRDRKSTRLNSSHVAISYAVFCLKKKNNIPL